MAKKTCYFQEYVCSCGQHQKHCVWSDELEKKEFDCTNEQCDKKVDIYNAIFQSTTSGPMIGKMSVEQIQKDRAKRNTDHFKREIFPTLAEGSAERKHFEKKHFSKSHRR